jgi:hypothetical protein
VAVGKRGKEKRIWVVSVSGRERVGLVVRRRERLR